MILIKIGHEITLSNWNSFTVVEFLNDIEIISGIAVLIISALAISIQKIEAFLQVIEFRRNEFFKIITQKPEMFVLCI
jgi:hypothetical protein